MESLKSVVLPKVALKRTAVTDALILQRGGSVVDVLLRWSFPLYMQNPPLKSDHIMSSLVLRRKRENRYIPRQIAPAFVQGFSGKFLLDQKRITKYVGSVPINLPRSSLWFPYKIGLKRIKS
ncbi:hypothetical protein [Pokkaliibacter plantistimulans]|uniref:hypothetical protein n=1 Tax=Pokkaliibacter plantistimulans TaxID=1635171 RepID=UPI001402A262|nr:hypothetical protein [Pokkaliibacter plantistimulans]